MLTVKRFIVTDKLPDGKAITLRMYYEDEAALRAAHKDLIAYTEDTDDSYKAYFQEIKEKAAEILHDFRSREVWKIPVLDGYVLFRPYIYDGEYLDGCEYQKHYCLRGMTPQAWILSNPKDFAEIYVMRHECAYQVVSRGLYGQPKLKKPDAIKGVKSSFSVPFLIHKGKPKAIFRCFVKGDDLYIKCTDYFSQSFQPPDPKDIGLPLDAMYRKYFGELPRGKKFVYTDCWGDIVLRNEAWLKFEGLIPWCKAERKWEIHIMLCCIFADSEKIKLNSGDDWAVFFERLSEKLKLHISEQGIEGSDSDE